MAWIDIYRNGKKEIYRVTEEAYELIFKEQGFEIVNKTEESPFIPQNENVQQNVQSKAELSYKRKYTKRKKTSN